MQLVSKNPATEEILATFDEISEKEVEEKIQNAHNAFLKWRETSFQKRAEKLFLLANVLRDNIDEYGALITKEMGKPITASKNVEIEKCAWVCEYYAKNGEKFLTPEVVQTDASESYVRFDPLGVLLAVMPWNFPFWQVIRFAAPALMAGNVGLVKHASNVPQSGRALHEAFEKAGFPKDVYQNLLIGSDKVEAIITNPLVKAVTLTGSEGAGSAVASIAGREIKKTVLELGGSDPFIILEDADVNAACFAGAASRLQSVGQSCIAAKRFIVVGSCFEEFLEVFKKKFESEVIGDPMDEKTTVGPVSSMRAMEEILSQVEKSVDMGAKIATGGKRYGLRGAFIEPTILYDVCPGMPAYDEEIFGPVASVIVVKNADEAVAVANSSPYGLGGSLWTKDIEKAKKMAEKIDSGAVFINGMTKSDPRLPFGGVKKSGYGRELSRHGIMEFINVKSIWIK